MANKKKEIVLSLCSCDKTISLNFRSISKSMMDQGVTRVIKSDRLCDRDGISDIHYHLKKNPDHLIIAGCSNKNLFYEILRYSHFPEENVSLVDIAVLSDWVHKDKDEATEKAKRLIFQEIMNVENKKDFEPDEDMKEVVVSLGMGPLDDLVIFGRVESCPSYRFGACSICADNCPKGAISGMLSINSDLCNGCGICISVCPLGILSSKNQEKLESKMKSMLKGFVEKKLISPKHMMKTPVMLFVCDNLSKMTLYGVGSKKLSYPADILPIPISCLSHVNLDDILMSFVLGSQGIILFACDSCKKDSKKYIEDLERTFSSLFQKTSLEGRLSVFRSNGRDPDQFHEYLVNFFEKIKSMDRLDIPNIDEFSGNKREDLILMLKTMLDDVSSDIKVDGGLLPFGSIQINEGTCDLCGECTRACLTNALVIKDEKLVFDHKLCIGCGACVKNCPSSSIELEKVIKVSKLFITDIVK
ncbi:MAG: hydrogenase iron-sulfur subunit [Methanocellales archaeon]|nr:hydrogenase iron-sulfur subunit [Methanocellales archaeon]